MPREYGYVRISTSEQHEDRQIIVMNEIGIKEEYIFIDRASGKNFDRPEYKLLKRVMREGDTLFVKAIDRFGRNKQEILREWQWLIDQNIDIVVIDMPVLDTRKYKGMEGIGQLITDIVLQILSWLAEEELRVMKQRQSEGIAAAKDKGKHLGRPALNLKTLSKEQARKLDDLFPKWKVDEITAVEFMKAMDLKKNSFYKIVKEYETTL
ncbi:recombinase family protein [Paenibacillus alba]|uniref:Recombinase family protein n=1 Tax=Paenibacillus alba TaxID=1197127 RepID=A0ABU6G167_9BACL|nr:recombinase family protein [Paenibacillus alba]MEC0227913.1 recombinase family protein [Paenibacillus alba]